MATSPAGCGADVVPQFEVHVGPDELASGAPSVLNSTPAEAVVSLEMMVLLMMFATNASCSEIPAPSQPATLSAMMLLVIFTEYQLEGVVGNVITSEPLTLCKRRPPRAPAAQLLAATVASHAACRPRVGGGAEMVSAAAAVCGGAALCGRLRWRSGGWWGGGAACGRVWGGREQAGGRGVEFRWDL